MLDNGEERAELGKGRGDPLGSTCPNTLSSLLLFPAAVWQVLPLLVTQRVSPALGVGGGITHLGDTGQESG